MAEKLNDVTVNRILDNFLNDDIFNIGKNFNYPAIFKVFKGSNFTFSKGFCRFMLIPMVGKSSRTSPVCTL